MAKKKKAKKPALTLYSKERLISLREKLGARVPEMAKALKLAAPTYYRFESGKARIRGPLVPLLIAIEKCPISFERLKAFR